MATAAWKIAPALAFGNAVIWKPANLTPASAWALAGNHQAAGHPQGAVAVWAWESEPQGSKLGDALAAEAEVQGISFTGSCEIGRAVAAAAAPAFREAASSRWIRSNLLVVMDDADLDRAVDIAINGAFGGHGQKSTASSRLIVHRPFSLIAFTERF